MNDQICIRPVCARTVGVAHAEAFQVMLYRPAAGGRDVWIWNSRDGVTPFGMSIDGVEYRHAMNAYAPVYSAVLPADVEHVWIDYSREAWEEMQRASYTRFASRPNEGEFGGDAFRERYPTVEDWLATGAFEHGQPRRVSVDDYLATTSAWIGRYPDAPRVPMRSSARAA